MAFKVCPCTTRLCTLPESSEDLPTAMQTIIYPDGCQSGHPTVMSLERLQRMIANFRLRDRKDGVASTSLPVRAADSSTDSMVQLMTACAGLCSRLRTMLPAQRSQSHLERVCTRRVPIPKDLLPYWPLRTERTGRKIRELMVTQGRCRTNHRPRLLQKP